MGGQGWRDRRRVLCALLAGALSLIAPAAARAAIDVGDVSLNEGNGGTAATFTITRSASLLAGATSVAFTTADASAHAPADYAPTSGSRSFPFALLGGTQVQTVTVPVEGDRLDEPNETFRLVVTGSEVRDGEGVATILDDDLPPSVGVADAAPAPEGANASFAIGLSAPSGRTVTVAFATANASAVAGEDYGARAGTLTIPAGATGATIGVALTDDSIDEPSETFELHLSAPTGATLGDAAATATILDNDPPRAAAPAPQQPAPGGGLPGSAAPPGPATAPATPSPTGGASTGARLAVGNPRLRQPATGLVTIACPPSAGTCSGQVTLFTRPNKRSKLKELRSERRLGRRTFKLVAGRTQTLTFALGRRDRGLLQRAGRMNVRAFAVTKDAAGQTSVRSASGVLLRRTAHSGPSAKRASARGEGLDEVGRALGAVVGRRPRL